MSRTNTFSSYGSIAKSFHWLTALLIFTAFPLGYFANEMAHDIQSAGFDGSPAVIERATLLFSLHKTIGVAVFFTALLRILWALSQPKPGLLHPDRKAEALAAEVVHWLLYGSLVAVPLTGWIHHAATTGFAPIWWPFGQSLPFVPKSDAVAGIFGSLHWLLVWTLAAALGLHIAGALKHHAVDRDATLRRMLPGSGTLPRPPAQAHSLLPLLAALLVWGGILGGGAALGLVGGKQAAGTGTAAPVVAAAPSAAAAPGGWAVQSGTLGLTVTQMGSAVSGSFGEWAAVITFEEPEAPGPAGAVEVTIAIPSLELGSVASQAMGADYFDSANFPTALFQAEIEKLAEGYEAVGMLTIKDQTVPVTLPFDLELEGNTARMTGGLTLNRLDFGIGKSLPDESSLGFAVDVAVELEAVRTE
ncbi:cytochrome b/b6 domain-containing protein [Leisingera daeponensis]|uniref:Cytochrome b/b6 domain-containing protein n=1 Tax=Leisingera daeponensis TaxID=405746 RepID=A0ABS7NCB1_9RHOB|nr:cytochrome b/b6 domain-containing protein [Leisingera daeponensis]MBY6138491.1 cytochrome b/b6 domain-containing protein [Leisingera daeponensis]